VHGRRKRRFSALSTSAFNTWSIQHLEHSTPFDARGAFDASCLTHSVIIRFIVTAIFAICDARWRT
jgi:hypothetical protein